MAKKILLVDDDMFIRDLYEELLRDEGYEMTTAKDGQEGLDKIRAGKFDLILLDVMMPKVDGLNLLKQLTNEEKKNNGPVILLTNLANDPIIKQAMELGAKNYLLKSDITPDVLLAEVRRNLTV